MDQKAVCLKSIDKKYPVLSGSSTAVHLGEFWALKGINLEIERGTTLGVIGRNGAGKTTLLHIISGVLSPTGGAKQVNGNVMGLFNLGVGFQDELSGRENIFLNGAILGAERREIDANLDKILEFSELGRFIDMPLGSYSQGMRLRLGFSIIANLDFDVFVIDEVLAVGDALFTNKCLERFMDFKRTGKTLILTTQAMDFIERLCDEVILLDHGHILFKGEAALAVDKYRFLLSNEKFFVGPSQKEPDLVKRTKRWADNTSDWGKTFGGKEVNIKEVELIGKNGVKTNQIKSQEPLTVKVHYEARHRIKNVHFGVAIFRSDGVYCYGPNTEFDGHKIPALEQGKGSFKLSYGKVLLAPGAYKISVAIWDKNEAFAFDYHYGFYDLTVTGADHNNGSLVDVPFKIGAVGMKQRLAFLFNRNSVVKDRVDLTVLGPGFGARIDTPGCSIAALNILASNGRVKESFVTNEKVCFQIEFSFGENARTNTKTLWFGIFRDDGVYCQDVQAPFTARREVTIEFPRLPLLPGGYCVSAGVWDSSRRKFLTCHHGLYPFRMVFDKQDHGTVYLDHSWDGEGIKR